MRAAVVRAVRLVPEGFRILVAIVRFNNGKVQR